MPCPTGPAGWLHPAEQGPAAQHCQGRPRLLPSLARGVPPLTCRCVPLSAAPQIYYMLAQGERPDIPPLEELPGPDRHRLAASYDDYTQLLRSVPCPAAVTACMRRMACRGGAVAPWQAAGPGTPPTADAGPFCGLPPCRDCWAEAPADRPGFAEVVPRLRAMLERLGSSACAATPLPVSAANSRGVTVPTPTGS